MTTKIITLDDHFPTGEPTVQLISTWGADGRLLKEATSIDKTAAHSPATNYIRSIEPEPGKSIVLVVGLGDHETYGPNRNGDGFPSRPIRGKIAAHEVLPKHFQSYDNAHVFEHHVNSDPEKAIGRVKKAFWNPYMHRVEVVEDFDHAKAPHLLEKIAAGEHPAKSMGCRIKYDVCTNCSNKARTRAEYCEHLKYAMNKIDPHTGEQNAALNPSPVFFDSSWVIRPADRTGYMLKKVAKVHPYELWSTSFDLGEQCDELSKISQDLRKAAEIEKIISGEPAATVSALDKDDARLVERFSQEGTPKDPKPLDKRIVKLMVTYKPSEAIGTSDDMDLPLGIKDLLNYFMGRMSNSSCECDDATEKSASQHLPLVYELFSAYPRFYKDLTKQAGLDQPYKAVPELRTKLAIYSPSTVTEDYMYRNTVPEALRSGERGLTDTMDWTDPNTGRQYQTNYGTVQKTNDALVEQGLKNKATTVAPMLGGSALLGAAAMSKRLPMLPRAGLAAGSLLLGGAGAAKALRPTEIAGPKIRTDQGETISGWTEMVPKRASHLTPEMDYIIKRAHDGKAPPLPRAYVAEFLTHLKTAEVHDELSTFIGPTLNLDKVAQALGNSILKWTE